MRIAYLEDDRHQAERVAALLEGAGHQVCAFDRGRALLARLASESFDLIVLDWEVPDVSGYEVLRTVRTEIVPHTPVLFVTHRDAESDVVQALEAGADDFVVKPPRERELLSRVAALGRRGRDAGAVAECIVLGPFRVDPALQRIERDGVPVELTRREFEVALLFFRNLGKVLSRAHIMSAVWRRGDAATTRTVDTHVSRLRAALGLSAAIGLRLTPVYGYGYRLEKTRDDAA